MRAFFLYSILFLFLAGCTSLDDSENPFQGVSAKELFNQAKISVQKGQYENAVKRLEALESMYPFSEYALESQMYLMFVYYQQKDYPSTAATAERFIRLYPRAHNIDYAYYMKGLANFQQIRVIFANILPLDESWRSPGSQTQAYSDFADLVQRFPNSHYKSNALQRMIYLRNMFAKRELNTANFYFARKKYVAAAERANFIIKNYPQAHCAKEALALLYSARRALGLQKAAAEALAVYEATYHSRPMLANTHSIHALGQAVPSKSPGQSWSQTNKLL